MKKLLSILLLFLSVKGVCQFPVNSTNGTATTTNLTRGIAAADSGFQYRSYFLDTASANRGRIDEVPGVMIRTAPNVIWLRNSTATAWIRQANINDIINITGCYTLLNGGIVTWSGTGLTMDVTLANYIIGCRFFTSPVSQVTLAGADVTNPRIDVIAVDTNNAVVVITGTPAANPVKPQVNTSSQLELTQILVPANATTPGGITQTIVYDENEGTPDEWDATFQAVNGTVNFASTSIPFHLTIDAVPSTDAEGLMLFTAAAPVSMTDYSVVKLYIYNGSSYGQADDIQISLYNSGNPVTGALSAESYGYSHAVAGSYQIVTIPMSVFIAGATDDLNQFDAIGIRIYESNSVNNLHFDYIQLQGGIPTGNSPYITNIFRIPGVDSFYFTRNGINYPIKDSIGSGGGSSYTFPYSVVAPGSAIQLENDTTANPANYFYGRNSVGRRGWYPQSGITGVNNGLVKNSSGVVGLDSAGVNPLTRLVEINANNNQFIIDQATNLELSGVNSYIYGYTQAELKTPHSFIRVKSDSILIEPYLGKLKIDTINYTLSTTGKKIMLRDTATGLVENIDPALIGGGGITNADNGLVKNSSGFVGLDSNGVNPLTRNVKIDGNNTKVFELTKIPDLRLNYAAGSPQTGWMRLWNNASLPRLEMGISSVIDYSMITDHSFHNFQNYVRIREDSTYTTKKFSYSTNLRSTFNQYSLVDKGYIDSLVATISGGGSGTVTSVATNNGTGITGGTITGSGTLAIDTANTIATRLQVQHRIDSLAAISGITVGTTTITSGTSGRIAYNNSGVYSESANLTQETNQIKVTGTSSTTPLLVDAHEDATAEILQVNDNATKVFSVNVDGVLDLSDNSSAPSTPASGYGRVYSRADSLRFKNDAGTEFTLGRNSGSTDSTVVRNQRWKYRNTFEDMEDFVYPTPVGWNGTTTGSGASALATDNILTNVDTTYWGVLYNGTGTTTTGKAISYQGNSGSGASGYVRKNNNKFYVYEIGSVWLPVLSDSTGGTEIYFNTFGLIDWWASSNPQTGIQFIYDREAYGNYWAIRSDNAGSVSTVVTTIPIVAATKYTLRFEITNWHMASSGGSIRAYINDTEVIASSGTYPIVSNLPQYFTANFALYPSVHIQKRAGTTNRIVYADWVYTYAELINR